MNGASVHSEEVDIPYVEHRPNAVRESIIQYSGIANPIVTEYGKSKAKLALFAPQKVSWKLLDSFDFDKYGIKLDKEKDLIWTCGTDNDWEIYYSDINELCMDLEEILETDDNGIGFVIMFPFPDNHLWTKYYFGNGIKETYTRVIGDYPAVLKDFDKFNFANIPKTIKRIFDGQKFKFGKDEVEFIIEHYGYSVGLKTKAYS